MADTSNIKNPETLRRYKQLKKWGIIFGFVALTLGEPIIPMYISQVISNGSNYAIFLALCASPLILIVIFPTSIILGVMARNIRVRADRAAAQKAK